MMREITAGSVDPLHFASHANPGGDNGLKIANRYRFIELFRL